MSAHIKVKHSPECRRVFGRYDADCARCQELITGAAPRKGWNDRKREMDAQFSRDVADHFRPGGPHATGACGPVCTFGDS